MKGFVRNVAVFLLLLNSVGALYGGGMLIYDPSGEALKVPLAWIQDTFFGNYLVPGIILFCVNGILSGAIAIAVIFKRAHYPRLVIIQGILLTGWIVIQVGILQKIHILHYVMGLTGLTLTALGMYMERYAGSGARK